MLPTLGQFITLTTDVTVDTDYHFVVLDEDGSRRVIRSGLFGPSDGLVENIDELHDGKPAVFWGPTAA